MGENENGQNEAAEPSPGSDDQNRHGRQERICFHVERWEQITIGNVEFVFSKLIIVSILSSRNRKLSHFK